MSSDRQARWQTASPYLDIALDLSPDERTAWLASIRATDPNLAALLDDWLAECDAMADDDFLGGTIAVEPSRQALAGLQVGAYRLVEPVGHGGMGSVWLAVRADGRFDGRVAVKLLNAALVGRVGEARFAREGRILARLTHPHIAHLVDAGVSPIGQPYLVIEYIDGVSIDRHCDQRGLSVTARVRLFLDVLSAVGHAHANLVVHRDLKPSNVLVTTDGQVKLLDFGIARLLEHGDDQPVLQPLTRDGDAMLTPAYAAPEQIARAAVTTATDVYALGVLLYELLAGRHPAEPHLDQPALLLSTIMDTEPPRMSDRAVDADARLRGRPAAIAEARATTPERLRRALRGDLDIIVLKALRKAPADRYGSVAALTEDLQRYLRGEPIGARAESVVYRAGTFVRRHRWGLAATAMVTLGLAASLVLVNRERTVAERRFAQVRELSNQLFEIDVQVRQLAGSTRTRQVIVDTALHYLRALADEVGDDPDLALDVGTAYLRVARVQGVPISANLGQSEDADESLRHARDAIDTVLRAQPANRMARLRAAQIAHDRMILAGNRRPDADALPLAHESAAGLERYLVMGPVPPAELESVLIVLNNVGNRFRIAGEFETAQRLTRQGIELARASGGLPGRLHGGALLIGLTRIHRDRAELDQALVAIRDAQRLLEPPDGRAAEVMGQTNSFVMALGTEAQLLGQRRGLSLGRPAEAVGPLQRGFDLLDPLVHRDAANADVRSRLSSIGLPLADNLADTDPARALAIYEHVLGHLSEVANNPRFRRIEVQALSGSARPLRTLGRGATAAARLDAAFDRLREAGLFPAEAIEFGSEADEALSALGDDLATRGELARAIATYQTLLDHGMAAGPRPDTDVADAHDLSRVYGALAALTARTGEHARAAELNRRREALWRHWSRQLPGNAFVVRQLAEATAATRAAQP